MYYPNSYFEAEPLLVRYYEKLFMPKADLIS